jgi:hypothetical protein
MPGMDGEAAQEREWTILHDRITETLQRFGKEDLFRKADYCLLDENLGPYRQELEVQNLKMLQPHIMKLLQALLADYPKWEITVRVDIPGTENAWPGMGLIIFHDEIVDELRRDFLPAEFQNITY